MRSFVGPANIDDCIRGIKCIGFFSAISMLSETGKVIFIEELERNSLSFQVVAMKLTRIEIRCAASGIFTEVYLDVRPDRIDFIGCSAYPAGQDACLRCRSNAVVAYMNPKAAKRSGLTR